MKKKKEKCASFFFNMCVSPVCTDCTGKKQKLKEIVRNMNEFPANYDPRDLDQLFEKDDMDSKYINKYLHHQENIDAQF